MRRLTEQWRRFAAQAPGKRFRDRYDEHQSRLESGAWWRRLVRLLIGVMSLGVAFVLTVAPGPAIVFYIIAALFLARESRTAARLLDRADVRIAPGVRFVARQWHRLSPRTRQAAVAGMILSSVASVVAGLLFLD